MDVYPNTERSSVPNWTRTRASSTRWFNMLGLLFRCGVLGVAIFLVHDFGSIAMGFTGFIVASIFDISDKIIAQSDRIQRLENRLTELSDTQFERTQSLERRLQWDEFKLGNVINRLNDDKPTDGQG